MSIFMLSERISGDARRGRLEMVGIGSCSSIARRCSPRGGVALAERGTISVLSSRAWVSSSSSGELGFRSWMSPSLALSWSLSLRGPLRGAPPTAPRRPLPGRFQRIAEAVVEGGRPVVVVVVIAVVVVVVGPGAGRTMLAWPAAVNLVSASSYASPDEPEDVNPSALVCVPPKRRRL